MKIITINLNDLSRITLKTLSDTLYEEARALVERNERLMGDDLRKYHRIYNVIDELEREAMLRPTKVI